MDVLKQKQKQAEVLAAARPPPVAFPPPPPVLAPPPPPTQVEGPPTRRNRGRGRRRNRKVAAGAADETSIGRQSGTS